jgi:hypothetical protein
MHGACRDWSHLTECQSVLLHSLLFERTQTWAVSFESRRLPVYAVPEVQRGASG